jgi:hypothetical protein
LNGADVTPPAGQAFCAQLARQVFTWFFIYFICGKKPHRMRQFVVKKSIAVYS